MAGTWTDLGRATSAFRDGVVDFAPRVVRRRRSWSRHFVAINAAIGAATGDDRLVIRSLDNCSITVVDVVDGGCTLVEGGHEADTLIR